MRMLMTFKVIKIFLGIIKFHIFSLSLFIGNFLYPTYYGLTIFSILIGFGAASKLLINFFNTTKQLLFHSVLVIWVAQGKFLTINSDEHTITRNSGVFWALFQGSLLFGNIFVFFEFQGQEVITEHVRKLTYSVLTGTCVIGIILLFFLQNVTTREERQKEKPGLIQNICK